MVNKSTCKSTGLFAVVMLFFLLSILCFQLLLIDLSSTLFSFMVTLAKNIKNRPVRDLRAYFMEYEELNKSTSCGFSIRITGLYVCSDH